MTLAPVRDFPRLRLGLRSVCNAGRKGPACSCIDGFWYVVTIDPTGNVVEEAD